MVKKLRIFKNAWFRRLARRQKITDKALREAVAQAEKGTVDADLGGHVIKQRIARSGQGKSGGHRTIIILKTGDKAFFVYGFAKSERENIDKREISTFKKAAKKLRALPDDQIQKLIAIGGLTEIKS